MKSLAGGIDIGSENHHIVIMGAEEKVLYDQKIRHKVSEFHRVLKELKMIERDQRGRISFAIEGKNGYGSPFDRLLIENGFPLYNVDNLKLKQFRNVFGAEWRNDRRDARMLAKMLKLREHVGTEREKAFLVVEKSSVINEKLKLLSRHQQGLIDEKVRVQNRLRKRLLELIPEIFELGDLDSTQLLRFLVKYPDIKKYRRLTLRSLMKIEMVGKKRAMAMLESLRTINGVKDLSDIYKTIILSYARRLLELKKEIKDIDKELEVLGEASQEVKRLRSITGIGVKLSSRLIGEIGNINRFKNESQLAVYCGVACIDDDSGKKKNAKAVYKANKICKATMIEIAGCTIRYNAESMTYYLKKRTEGKEHNHALRCLARQLIKVIYKMLLEDRNYVAKEEMQKAA